MKAIMVTRYSSEDQIAKQSNRRRTLEHQSEQMKKVMQQRGFRVIKMHKYESNNSNQV